MLDKISISLIIDSYINTKPKQKEGKMESYKIEKFINNEWTVYIEFMSETEHDAKTKYRKATSWVNASDYVLRKGKRILE
jgi:hypothetical protein